MAILLPSLLRLTNSALRLLVGAEGRLAAVSVDTDRVLGPLSTPWAALAQGGENLPGFLNGIEGQIQTIQPHYIRIDHIYDQFDVVGRANGALTFNWSQLDAVVAKIRATGATPFLSLSYMPPALATGDVTSEPTNWDEWSLLVQKTIEHYSGDLRIPNMYYEVWNEPDLFGGWKMGGKKDYKQLYLYAARGAERAKASQAYKLGGPGTTGLYRNWMDQFFPFILKNSLRFDFFSWHRYDLDLDSYMKDVDQVDMWLERHPYFSNVEKIITEFGPQSAAGGYNNSRVGAAHMVAVMRELLFKIKYGFTFAVSGSWGIINTPRYSALVLLSQLGDSRLSITGEGTWVRVIGAKKGNVYQVLLTNYDPQGVHSEVVPVTFLGLKERSFVLREKFLGGGGRTEEVATTEALLQHDVPLTPNSVVLLELEPR